MTLALAITAFSNFVVAGAMLAERRRLPAIANFCAGVVCALVAMGRVA